MNQSMVTYITLILGTTLAIGIWTYLEVNYGNVYKVIEHNIKERIVSQSELEKQISDCLNEKYITKEEAYNLFMML
jgi:hypothetical protein